MARGLSNNSIYLIVIPVLTNSNIASSEKKVKPLKITVIWAQLQHAQRRFSVSTE